MAPKSHFLGPDFLWKTEDYWPQSPIPLPPLLEFDIPMQINASVFLLTSGTERDILDQLIAHYSSLNRVKKAVAWILRAKNFLRAKVKSKHAKFDCSDLTVQDLQQAQTELIKHVQKQHLSNLISFVGSGGRGMSKLPRFLQKLSPIILHDVVRVDGRLRNAPVSLDSKFPIILPSDSHFTELVILDHHAKVGHSGMGHTWSSLRQKFWIIKGSTAVRRVIGKCLFCRKRNASLGFQLMADLPPGRLQLDKPVFSHVGIDYFGPILVTQGRKQVKLYGCIFTCLTVRAVHIEISHDLTTDSFLNALRRFIARRGQPEHIRSDNGTNLAVANKVLRNALKEWNQSHINDYLRQRDVQWTFNPPAASHMGGSWERLIRSVRRILSSLLTSQSISDEVLLTVMAEAESIVNSRPLVPIIFQPGEELLTPNHLLLLRGNANLPPGLLEKKECYPRHRWRQAQFLANQFWQRFKREFLPHIIHRQKWFNKQRNLRINDVVLIADDSAPRSRWALERITSVYPGSNGTVRTVLVKTGVTTLKRPIHKLCLVEEAQKKKIVIGLADACVY